MKLNSRQEELREKGGLGNFTKFTGKYLGLPATLLNKRLWHRCFSVSFVKFIRTPFLTENLWQLLLYVPI